MVGALKARVAAPEQEGDVRVVLAATEVPLDVPPVALSFATSVSASVQAAEGASGQGQVTAQGEASVGDGSLAQFGLTTLHVPRPAEPDPAAAWPAAELTEGSVATTPARRTCRERPARRRPGRPGAPATSRSRRHPRRLGVRRFVRSSSGKATSARTASRHSKTGALVLSWSASSAGRRCPPDDGRGRSNADRQGGRRRAMGVAGRRGHGHCVPCAQPSGQSPGKALRTRTAGTPSPASS